MALPTANRTEARVPEWDAIRGLAILLVVFHHYVAGAVENTTGALPNFIRATFPLSWTGVDLFFVLSGFLIGGILMDHRDSGNYFKTFYIRRFCRIVPLYFAWIILFLALSTLFPRPNAPEWHSTVFTREIPHFPRWGYFLFLQNFYTATSGAFGSPWLAATWSLAVEEQFYLVLPLTLWFIPAKRRFPVLLCLIILVPALRMFLFLFHSGTFVYVLLPCRADTLLLGVLCACLIREPNCFTWLQKHQSWLHISFLILLLGMVGMTIYVRGSNITILNSFEMVTFGFTWIALFYSCFLLIVATAKTDVLAPVLRNRLLCHFGLIAYGMYLMHMVVNTAAHGLILGKSAEITNLADAAVTVLAFFITWLLALLSWNYFEKRVIRWGHSFVYGKKTSTSSSTTPLAPCDPVSP